MTNNPKARIALLAGALAAALSVAGIAGIAAAQPTTADTPTATPTSDRTPHVEEQHGIVLEVSGSAGDLTVSATVYENSVHGNSVQVVLGDDRIGYAESTDAYVVDGVLSATVDIDGRPAVLSGRIEETGHPERLVEPVQDGGEQVVTRGTHTQLAGSVTLTYGDAVVPLDLATAFRYDLEVRKVSLYGR